MPTLKLTTIGNSTEIVLPKEILERLRIKKGDSLHVLETPRGIELTPFAFGTVTLFQSSQLR